MSDNTQNSIQSAPQASGSGGNDAVSSQTPAQEQQSRAASAADAQGGDTPTSNTARSGRKSSSSEVRR